jgi:hypothetical protein
MTKTTLPVLRGPKPTQIHSCHEAFSGFLIEVDVDSISPRWKVDFELLGGFCLGQRCHSLCLEELTLERC